MSENQPRAFSYDLSLWAQWMLAYAGSGIVGGCIFWLIDMFLGPSGEIGWMVFAAALLLPHWLVLRPYFRDAVSTGIVGAASAPVFGPLILAAIFFIIDFIIRVGLFAASTAAIFLVLVLGMWVFSAYQAAKRFDASQGRWAVAGGAGFFASLVPIALLIAVSGFSNQPNNPLLWLLGGFLSGLVYSLVTGALLGWCVRGKKPAQTFTPPVSPPATQPAKQQHLMKITRHTDTELLIEHTEDKLPGVLATSGGIVLYWLVMFGVVVGMFIIMPPSSPDEIWIFGILLGFQGIAIIALFFAAGWYGVLRHGWRERVVGQCWRFDRAQRTLFIDEYVRAKLEKQHTTRLKEEIPFASINEVMVDEIVLPSKWQRLTAYIPRLILTGEKRDKPGASFVKQKGQYTIVYEEGTHYVPGARAPKPHLAEHDVRLIREFLADSAPAAG